MAFQELFSRTIESTINLLLPWLHHQKPPAKPTKGYTCYHIDDESKQELLKTFPPKYDNVFAEHITDKFFVEASEPITQPLSVRVVGYANSDDGLECLVVEVNGSIHRADGSLYHITLSLDPDATIAEDISNKASDMGYRSKVPGYTPANSNHLLQSRGYTELPEDECIRIKVEPKFFSFHEKKFLKANVVLPHCFDAQQNGS